MLLAFIRREDYCNAWHPMAGGGGESACRGVLCQAPRSRETSSLEMAKKLALLVPGVPRSHGAELSKRCTMKSLAKASNSFSTINCTQGSLLPILKNKSHLLPPHGLTQPPHPQHTVCCHHPTPFLRSVGLSVCSDGELTGWATCQLCVPCRARRSGCSPEVD